MELYNPKDCWHHPYLIITDLGVYRNRPCALTESDYERMCEIHGVNPIYPSEFMTLPDPEEPEKPKEKKEKPKKITPRPPKESKTSLNNVYDRIKKRREELGITI